MCSLGAPAIEQSSGVFCAGNDTTQAAGDGATETVVVNTQKTDSELEWTDAQPREVGGGSVITATEKEDTVPRQGEEAAKAENAQATSNEEDVLDSVSEAAPTSQNPYWKKLGRMSCPFEMPAFSCHF